MKKRNILPHTKQHTAFFRRIFLWLLIFSLSILTLISLVFLYFLYSGFFKNPTMSIGLPLFFLFFAIILISLLFAAVISLRIAGPLRRMRKIMDLMAEGDFANDISIRENDELYGLSISLRHISEKISVRLENLELSIKRLKSLSGKYNLIDLYKASSDLLDDYRENFEFKKITK